jgi:putative transposase
MPKSGLKAQYPDLKNDWLAFGVIQKIIMDNGLEFHSDDLENACLELGIEQHFAPRKVAWFKGKIERFQGTLNRELTAGTPGKTFASIFERDDYDPQKHAVLGITQLRHLIIRWIVDVYHQRTHRALDCSPQTMWTTTVRTEDIPLIDCPIQFDAILGGVEHRKLTHKGIEFNGLFYNSPDLTNIRRQLGDSLDVEIRFDRSNLGSIIVLHPGHKTPHRVPCLRPDYAEGLTEWQHKICKRFTRERYRAGNDVDAWLDALLEICNLVGKDLNLGKRGVTTKERVARWNQGKSADAVTACGSRETSKTMNQSLVIPNGISAETQSTQGMPSIVLEPTVRRRFSPIVDKRATVAMEGGE